MTRPAPLHVRQIPLGRLHTAPWNANVVPAATLAKIRRSVADFGIVENLVARPLPNPCPVCGGKDHLEVISGNHRLEIYGEFELPRAPVHEIALDDAHARLLAETLNNTRGAHDPEKYTQLLNDMLERLSVATITAYLPESEHSIEKYVGEQIRQDANFATMPPTGKPKSKPGEIYELGPHRLMCGDALNADHVAKLLDGAEPALLLADPPYGVDLDLDWRGKRLAKGKGKGKAKASRTSTRATSIQNDDRVDWSEAFAIVPSLKVAYVWHSSWDCARIAQGLEAIGLHVAQLIIWDKGAFPLGRSHYQWQHEVAWYACNTDGAGEIPWYAPRHVPAFYARKKGSGMPWLGGHDQTTIWLAPSPKLRTKGISADDSGVDHPTQKPVEIYTRPIKNHLQVGESLYDPFAGSGTAIIAGEITGRRCFAMELDPRFVDVARERYADYVGKPEYTP